MTRNLRRIFRAAMETERQIRREHRLISEMGQLREIMLKRRATGVYVKMWCYDKELHRWQTRFHLCSQEITQTDADFMLTVAHYEAYWRTYAKLCLSPARAGVI